MHRFTSLIISLIIVQVVSAQQAPVTFQIHGLKSTDLIIGYYLGGKAFIVDSVNIDTITGHFSLQGAALQPGVFFCRSLSGKLFDFLIINPADSVHIEANMLRLDSLWSGNSVENDAYFRFEQQRKSIESLFETKRSMRNMIAQATKNDPEALRPVETELHALLNQTDSLVLDYVQKHPGHLYAKMLRSVRPPNPPRTLSPVLKSGKPNPAFSLWVRQHYWDNTDFKDESLLNNTFWQVYFDNFFSRHVVLQADSIILALDEVLAKTPKNGAFYRFIVNRITQYYEQNDAPGADRIFVHMVDKYLKKKETPWLDIATLERLEYKANINRPNLTESLATNFTMPDEKGQAVELYAVQAPITLLIFYSPLCSHCMELMPKIYQIYLDFQPKGLAALAVNTDKETEYWKKFSSQQNWLWYDVSDPKAMEQLEAQYATYNLPLIYVLDKDKKILAKRVKPNELGDVLGGYFGK